MKNKLVAITVIENPDVRIIKKRPPARQKVRALIEKADVSRFLQEVMSLASIKAGVIEGDLSSISWSDQIFDAQNWARLDQIGAFVGENRGLFLQMAEAVHDGYVSMNKLGFELTLDQLTPQAVQQMIDDGILKSTELLNIELQQLEGQLASADESAQGGIKKQIKKQKEVIQGLEYILNRYQVKGKGKLFAGAIADRDKFAEAMGLDAEAVAKLGVFDQLANSLLYPWQTLMADIDSHLDSSTAQAQKEFLVGLQAAGIANNLSIIAGILQGYSFIVDSKATDLDNVLQLIHASWSFDNSWDSQAQAMWADLPEGIKALDFAIFKSVVEQMQLENLDQIEQLYDQGLARFNPELYQSKTNSRKSVKMMLDSQIKDWVNGPNYQSILPANFSWTALPDGKIRIAGNAGITEFNQVPTNKVQAVVSLNDFLNLLELAGQLENYRGKGVHVLNGFLSSLSGQQSNDVNYPQAEDVEVSVFQ